MKARIFTILVLIFLGRTVWAHPIHISVVNLDVIADSHKIDYSVQLFYEDFQALINYRYNTMIDFKRQTRMTFKEQNSILDYISSRFRISTDSSKALKPEFSSWKIEDQSIWLFFCAELDKKVSELHIFNELLIDLYNDQTNYMIIRNGDTETGIEFNKRKTNHSFKL
jgi:hypothetical protein